jgi:hypothetical protein
MKWNSPMRKTKKYSQYYQKNIWYYFYWRSLSYDTGILWSLRATSQCRRNNNYRWCHQISLENERILRIPRLALSKVWSDSNRSRWWNYGDTVLNNKLPLLINHFLRTIRECGCYCAICRAHNIGMNDTVVVSARFPLFFWCSGYITCEGILVRHS